jgi:hypothetical protein
MPPLLRIMALTVSYNATFHSQFTPIESCLVISDTQLLRGTKIWNMTIATTQQATTTRTSSVCLTLQIQARSSTELVTIQIKLQKVMIGAHRIQQNGSKLCEMLLQSSPIRFYFHSVSGDRQMWPHGEMLPAALGEPREISLVSFSPGPSQW